ncbi:hypothetical protein [Microbacterium sp. gxy059]|uniref:hypothetical protein n=1 Tax=Microbacterium sp. gxy059 TaxID=2957199 RepID=UPI003D97C058
MLAPLIEISPSRGDPAGAGKTSADTLGGMSAEAWVAVVAVIVAVAALGVSWWQGHAANATAREAREEAARANEYAAKANTIAERADAREADSLRLQKRIDARAAEFRDVRWKGIHERKEDGWYFRLENVGLSSAENVTLVVDTEPKGIVMQLFGELHPGDKWEPKTREAEDADDHPEYLDGWRVYWSSPLGHADKHVEPRFEYYDEIFGNQE